MSRDDVRRIGEAAVKAAERQFLGKQYALVVIVGEVGTSGSPINVATNITSGKEHVLRLLQEGLHVVRGGA